MEWRPRPWTDDELETDRLASLAALNESAVLLDATIATYDAAYAEAEPLLREILAGSRNLRELDGAALRNRPELLAIARFLAAPPLSHDNLVRLVGRSIGSGRLDDGVAEFAAKMVARALDHKRFPWVAAQRDPAPGEVEAAVLATLTLVATQRTGTLQRNGARRLELLATQSLDAAGLVHYTGRPSAPLPWGLPAGSYSYEARVAGTNCDCPAHVRALEVAFLIECKGSSTQINGTKRLKSVKEAAATWRRSFGDQVLTVALISGAFTLKDLRATQSDGVFIVWEHNTAALTNLAAGLLDR